MDKFDEQWEKDRAQWDAAFKKATRYTLAAWIAFSVVGLTVLGFLGWLVVSVLRNFGWI